MKTSELTGALLDYWVARAEGLPKPRIFDSGNSEGSQCYYDDERGVLYDPSTDWTLGGPLIEKYGLDITLDEGNGAWYAMSGNLSHSAIGIDPLQAICRAVVRAAFGDKVPDA